MTLEPYDPHDDVLAGLEAGRHPTERAVETVKSKHGVGRPQP
jgi:hypothetical protein